jgi:hypothetical protein
MNYKDRPNLRGASMILRVEGADADRAWAIERIGAVIEVRGPHRKL